MNVKNLRDNYPKLISYMETNGYSTNYVSSFKREIEQILAAVDSRQWSCYADIYLDYTKASHSSDFLRINGRSLAPLSSLMFMVGILMGDAGMNSLKEALIPCCHRSLNLSSIFTVRWMKNVARNPLPFIPSHIMHPLFSYPSNKKE